MNKVWVVTYTHDISSADEDECMFTDIVGIFSTETLAEEAADNLAEAHAGEWFIIATGPYKIDEVQSTDKPKTPVRSRHKSKHLGP